MKLEMICPDLEKIVLFQKWELPEMEAKNFQEHLETCSVCLARLESLPDSDPFVVDLQGVDYLNDPAVEKHVATLRDILQDRLREDTKRHVSKGSPEDPRREPPSHIGRYEILEEFNSGGMGIVYKAHDPDLKRLVAVKLPRLAGRDFNKQARERFLREAQAAARVRHPHLCPIYDVGQHEGLPYVVMEFVEGQSLHQRLQQGRFDDPREAAALVIQVARALHAVHEHGIIHRDLKPGNILLDKDGRPVLTDFGLALWTDEHDRLTSEGAIPGTPPYLAPEQIDPALGIVGARTDLYSLGIVLFEMLTGERAFTGTLSALFRQITIGDPPDLRSRRPDLSSGLVAIVQKAMARQPEERFHNACDLANALEKWSAGDDTTQAFLDRPISAAGKKRSRKANLAASLVAALLLVGVAYFGWHHFSEPQMLPNPDERSSPNIAPLQGTIDLRMWRPNDPARQDVWIRRNPNGLPLKPGDQVRVDITVSRPAYVYVIQIESSGKVVPVYPWKEQKWNSRPPVEKRTDILSLPEETTAQGEIAGFKMEPGANGMETIVLLARAEPLPATTDLEVLLGSLPPQKEQSLRAVIWFDNGAVKGPELTRGFVPFDPKRIDDPVLQTQGRLMQKLRNEFDYIGALSYAVKGE